MASVTSNLTRVHDLEGSPTFSNIGSGGGAGVNTDIFLQASQSGARRRSGVTLEGFWLDDGAGNNLSAADCHVAMWCWVTHYGNLTALQVWLGDSTSVYDQHALNLTEYPALGGWVRVWIDVSRTPDATAGGGSGESSVRYFGLAVSLPSVGGTSPNVVMDAIDYVNGGAALVLTGTSGVFADFATSDQNTTNQYGVFRLIGGVYNCLARVQLGSASSLVFTDGSFTIIFPQQALVNDTWMGITIDLQHASTSVTWLSCVVQSSATKKGDLVVTGTSGTFTAVGLVAGNLRIVTLNSKCSVTQSAIGSCGQITAAGATLTSTQVSGYEGTANTSALIWDVATNPSTPMTGMTYTKGTAATHAIEFGTTSPTSMTLTNVTFSGYNASNNVNDSAIHFKRTTGTVTLTISGGTTPSYRTDGATISIVAGAVTVAVNVKNTSGSNISGARVLLKAASGGPFPFDVTVTISNSGTTATVTHTGHGLATNDYVVIKGASLAANNGVWQITVTGSNSYTYTMASSPGSSPTGTIKATYACLYGTTDGSGNLSTSKVYSSAQPVSGWVRKATGSPLYKTAALGGSVSNSTGYSASVQMIADE